MLIEKLLIYYVIFINIIGVNKLIDICNNRYESRKIKDNYFDGTNYLYMNITYYIGGSLLT